MSTAADAVHADGRIGPNAVIRLAEALRVHAPAHLDPIFAAAGRPQWTLIQPREMVPEADVRRLHATMRQEIGEAMARTVSQTAGHLTGDYLLAHRIPAVAQTLIGWLPARLGLRLLVKAITRNAWTFAGTGALHVIGWRPLVLEISDCPLCHGHRAQSPCCSYYAATFEQLFRKLVAPGFRFEETACMAQGAAR